MISTFLKPTGQEFKRECQNRLCTRFTLGEPAVQAQLTPPARGGGRGGGGWQAEEDQGGKTWKIGLTPFIAHLEQAAECLHRAGRKLQVHLRHCHQEPRMSSEFNELGFWAMPRILLDWRKAIDLADEITIKDYYRNDYRPEMSAQIKRYAREQGKRLWVHCYISQGRELNDAFLDALEADPEVGGVLLYEICHADKGECERNLGLIEQVGLPSYYQPLIIDRNPS